VSALERQEGKNQAKFPQLKDQEVCTPPAVKLVAALIEVTQSQDNVVEERAEQPWPGVFTSLFADRRLRA
jgi:hypothetical protein